MLDSATQIRAFTLIPNIQGVVRLGEINFDRERSIMSHAIRLLIILCFSAASVANYDPEHIKREIAENTGIFQVKSWTESESGDSWSANTSLKKTFITVSNDVAGIVLGLQSSDEALQGMMLCMEFARLGAQAGDKADALKLADAIDSAISQQTEKAVVVNNVKFEVVPKELAGKVLLFCRVKRST